MGVCVFSFNQLSYLDDVAGLNVRPIFLSFFITAIFLLLMAMMSFLIPVILGIIVCYGWAFELSKMICARSDMFNAYTAFMVVFIAMIVPLLYFSWKMRAYYLILTTATAGGFCLTLAFTFLGFMNPVSFIDVLPKILKGVLIFALLTIAGCTFQIVNMEPDEKKLEVLHIESRDSELAE